MRSFETILSTLSAPSEINHEHGGRGLYLLDPSGHYLELITRPYL